MDPNSIEAVDLHLVSVDDESEKIHIRAHKTEAIAAFKLRVANMFGISAENQLQLFYKEKPFRDDMTLGECVKIDNVMKVKILPHNVKMNRKLKIIGPIPGIEVGTSWSFRMQAKKAGVHEEHISGICGTKGGVAYSVALCGGYENIDNGDIIVYTGSGGKEKDQVFTEKNESLARNCNTAFNSNGAVAESWEEGTPVRVLRKVQLDSNSPYSRKDLYNYDGLYYVVAYWREVGKKDFLICRYLMKRKDSLPIEWDENLDKKYNGNLNKIKAEELEKEVETKLLLPVIQMRSLDELTSISNLDLVNEDHMKVGKIYNDYNQILSHRVNQLSHQELPENSHKDSTIILSLCDGNNDDVDNGDIIIFTGVHGEEEENSIYNQEMIGYNEILAENCHGMLKKKLGAVAEKWSEGRPVKVFQKVIASCKICDSTIKKEAHLYRGTYKVVGYWPQKGKSGVKIFRFLLVRDVNSNPNSNYI